MRATTVSSSEVSAWGTLSAHFYTSGVFEYVKGADVAKICNEAKCALESLTKFEREYLSHIASANSGDVGQIDLSRALSDTCYKAVINSIGDGLDKKPKGNSVLVCGVILGLCKALSEAETPIQFAKDERNRLLSELAKIEVFLSSRG